MATPAASRRATTVAWKEVGRDDDDDDTDASPEPSPVGPPPPHQQFPVNLTQRHLHQKQLHRPWTPHPKLNQLLDDDEESLPSLPEAPSPYSPPSPSLFSTDEWPTAAKSARKSSANRQRPPLSEVRMNYPRTVAASDTFDSSDRSLEHRLRRNLTQSLPSGGQQHQSFYSNAERSHILPAVRGLQQDLQSSHQTLYLLQEENKALVSECDRLQAQLNDMSTKNKQQKEECESAQQVAMDRLMAENKNYLEDKKVLDERIQSLEETAKELQQAEKEKSKLQEQLKDMKEAKDEAVRSMSAVDQEKEKLSNELANAKVRVDSCGIERKKLTKEIESLQQEIQELKGRLKEQSNDGAKKIKKATDGLEAKQKHLVEENRSHRLEIDRLKAMLKDSEKQNAKTTATQAGLDKEVDRLKTAVDESNTKNRELLAEKVALRKELARMNRSRHEVACQTEAKPKISVGTQTDTEDEPSLVVQGSGNSVSSGSSLAERLGRIRDAAERAALVREYRREISRLRSEHDAEMKRLTQTHEETLKQVLREAKNEVNASSNDYRHRIQSEYEARIAGLERKHQTELTRTKQEFEKTAAAAEQAMKVAIEEASSTTDKLNRQVAARERLEQTVQDLERQLESKQNEKLAEQEVMSLRKEWEEEMNALIASIQKECNAVFDQSKSVSVFRNNKVAPSNKSAGSKAVEARASPKSVLIRPISMDEEDTATIRLEKAVPLSRPTAARWNDPSSAFSSLDIDQALDETEALVRSLVGNDFTY